MHTEDHRPERPRGMPARSAFWATFLSLLLGAASAAEPPATFACGADPAAAADRIVATFRAEVGDVSRLPDDPDGLKALLAAMRRGDQDIRFLMTRLVGRCGLRPDDAAVRPVLAAARTIDDADRDLLDRILARKGWPVIPTYGEEADQSAFLVAQHATRDPAFQKRVLAILEEKLRTHETSGENYALLLDRVRIAEGQPQRYGSQGQCDGKDWVPRPVEDPSTLDVRRASVGLEPMAAYRAKVAGLFCAGGG